MKIHAEALLVLIVLSAPGAAADVYKCKGAKGETIYQNLPCPAGAAELSRGSYAPAPDDPGQSDGYGARQAHPPAGGNQPASASGTSDPAVAAYECEVNGKAWVQARPCPTTSTRSRDVDFTGTTNRGTPVHGTGSVDETVPVKQTPMSKDDLCTKLKSDPAVSERGKSLPKSGYERNKLRTANGC